jgi:hypothetical protein
MGSIPNLTTKIKLDMLIPILVVNITFVVFLFIVRSKRNIESRTEREEKILRSEKN